MKTIITILIIVCVVTSAKSQTDSAGELQGRLFDASTHEGIPFAAVVLESDGMQKGIGQTDDDGNYIIKPIVPGSYELRVQYLGYVPVYLQGIRITSGMISFQNISMQLSVQNLNASVRSNPNYVNCTPARATAVDQNAVAGSADHAAGGCLSVSGVSQSDNYTSLNIGGRVNGNVYCIDGMPCCGLILPAERIEDITIITGGIPAKYENANDAIDFSELKTPDKSIAKDAPALHALRFQF